MVIDEILAANETFLSKPQPAHLSHLPRRRVAVVTCMDTRLTHLFEEALGVDPTTFPEQGDDLLRWLGTFQDVRENTARTARAIRTSPYLPHNIPVHALVIDVHTGKLEMIERGE